MNANVFYYISIIILNYIKITILHKQYKFYLKTSIIFKLIKNII